MIIKRQINRKKKFCSFCAEHVDLVDYKDLNKLNKFVSDRGKILPRRVTGTCAKHQRMITGVIKRARHLALLPFSQN
jgi:small subunit ribosomal protein S18